MTTKPDLYEQFTDAKNEFVNLAAENHSYAYVTGYLSADMNGMFALLSSKNQAYILKCMEDALRREQSQAATKRELKELQESLEPKITKTYFMP